MTPTPVLVLLAAALGSCATTSSKTLPVCDGAHRRPANPHGSVLDAASLPPGATPAALDGSGAPAAPALPSAPPPPSGCGA